MRLTKKQQIIEIFEDGKPHTTNEISLAVPNICGSTVSTSVGNLCKEGYLIRLAPGFYKKKIDDYIEEDKQCESNGPRYAKVTLELLIPLDGAEQKARGIVDDIGEILDFHEDVRLVKIVPADNDDFIMVAKFRKEK